MPGAAESKVQIFQNIHATQEDKGTVISKDDLTQFDAARCHCTSFWMNGAYRLWHRNFHYHAINLGDVKAECFESTIIEPV
jgi:hypothetical protein